MSVQLDPSVFGRALKEPEVVRINNKLKAISIVLQVLKEADTGIYQKCLKDVKPIDDRLELIIKTRENSKRLFAEILKINDQLFKLSEKLAIKYIEDIEKCLNVKKVVVAQYLALLKQKDPVLSSRLDLFLTQFIVSKIHQEKGIKRKRIVESSNDEVVKASDKRAKTSKDSPA